MITIAVCTLDPRREYFARCMQSVLAQSLAPSSYEVLVIDNGSRAPVAGLPAAQDPRVQVIREERPGLTAARECAARAARHDLLLFVDDDNVLHPDYAQRVIETFADARIGYLSGEILPEYESPPPPWFSRFEILLAVRRFPARRMYLTSIPEYNRYFPVGAGGCIRRTLLVEYFDTLHQDERIEGRSGQSLSSGEDQDIAMFAISRGYQVGSSPALQLKHLIPASRLQLPYLRKLARAQIESAYLVNRKWRAVFGTDVIDTFATPRDLLLAKAALCTLLAFALPRYKIPAVVYRRALALQRRDAQ